MNAPPLLTTLDITDEFDAFVDRLLLRDGFKGARVQKEYYADGGCVTVTLASGEAIRLDYGHYRPANPNQG